VYTDYSLLQHILNQPWLTNCQMSYLKWLQDYDYNIAYLSGTHNVVEDALSYRLDHKNLNIDDTEVIIGHNKK